MFLLCKAIVCLQKTLLYFYDNDLVLSVHHQLCKTGGSSQQTVSIHLATGNEHESLML